LPISAAGIAAHLVDVLAVFAITLAGSFVMRGLRAAGSGRFRKE